MPINLKNPFREMKLDVRSLLLGSFAGLTVGGTTAYLVLRRTMESRFNDRLDAEVAVVRALYNDRLKAQLSDAISLVPEIGNPFVGRSVPDLGDPGTGDDDHGFSAVGDHAVDEVVWAAEQGSSVLSGGIKFDPYEGIDGDDGADDGDPDSARANEEANRDDESGHLVLAESAPDVSVARDLRRPYMISAVEFADSPPEWQQLTLTFHVPEAVLVDDKNQPIEGAAVIRTVGPIKQVKFGAMSGDPNICYIRNQELEIDFEIVRDARSYAEAVLGYGKPNRGS